MVQREGRPLPSQARHGLIGELAPVDRREGTTLIGQIEGGLILVAASFDQLEPYLAPLPKASRKAMLETWPGPVTWVAPAASWVPMDITGGRSTVAVRVSAHAGVQALCLAADSALISTSANRSGRSPARSLLEARLRFGREVDDIVPGKVGGLTGPTEIRDALSGRILRPAARGASA